MLHFPRVTSIEQQFFPYVFEWAIYAPYDYNYNIRSKPVIKLK